MKAVVQIEGTGNAFNALSWRGKNGVTIPGNQIVYDNKAENPTLMINKQGTAERTSGNW